MYNVINLREVLIEKVEKEAKEKLGAIKVVEDFYMVPTNKICSKDVTNTYLDSKIYSDLNLAKEIRKLKFKENDYISIRCKKEKRNNVKILELLIITEDRNGEWTIDIKVKSDLSYEDREALIHLIANENRDKLIFITFHEYHTFDSLERLINV